MQPSPTDHAHDRAGQFDRSICGACYGAYAECTICGTYTCECWIDSVVEQRADLQGRLARALTAAADWLNDMASQGLDFRIKAHVKTAEEAAELAAGPIIEEWADVAICLVGCALGQGWSIDDLAAAVEAKVAKNRARTWAQSPDGTWRHTNTEPIEPNTNGNSQ